MDPQSQNQPPYQPQSPPPAYQQPTENPGKGLGIAGIILGVLVPLVGLILSIVSRNKSKAAGMPTGLGTAGIIVSIIFMIISSVFVVVVGLTAYRGIQERATEDGAIQLTTSDNGVASRAQEVKKRAEAYFEIEGDYPKTVSDFSDHVESTLPDDISVTTLIYTNQSPNYTYCEEGAAQIIYLGNSKEEKIITPLGTASSVLPC